MIRSKELHPVGRLKEVVDIIGPLTLESELSDVFHALPEAEDMHPAWRQLPSIAESPDSYTPWLATIHRHITTTSVVGIPVNNDQGTRVFLRGRWFSERSGDYRRTVYDLDLMDRPNLLRWRYAGRDRLDLLALGSIWRSVYNPAIVSVEHPDIDPTFAETLALDFAVSLRQQVPQAIT